MPKGKKTTPLMDSDRDLPFDSQIWTEGTLPRTVERQGSLLVLLFPLPVIECLLVNTGSL